MYFASSSEERVVTAALQLRKENIILRAKNLRMKEDAAQDFNDAKEALSEVIDTSKSWAVKSFEMLTEQDNIPHYRCRLDFQKNLHRAMVAGEESRSSKSHRTMRKRPLMRKGLQWTMQPSLQLNSVLSLGSPVVVTGPKAIL